MGTLLYKIPSMNAEQEKIWNSHQDRLAKIQQEINRLNEGYQVQKRSLAASFGSYENIPKELRENLDLQFSEKSNQLKAKQTAELNLVQSLFIRNDLLALDRRQRAEEIAKKMEEKRNLGKNPSI